MLSKFQNKAELCVRATKDLGLLNNVVGYVLG